VPPTAVIALRKNRGRKAGYTDPVFTTARRDLDDIAEHREPADRTDRTEPKEPIEKAERNDPTDPIERAEPIEPIDMKDPRLPIDRTEFSDHSDHRERAVLDAMPHSCRWIGAALLSRAPCRLVRPSAPRHRAGTLGLGIPMSPKGAG
jgi:hypothetical protein